MISWAGCSKEKSQGKATGKKLRPREFQLVSERRVWIAIRNFNCGGKICQETERKGGQHGKIQTKYHKSTIYENKSPGDAVKQI